METELLIREYQKNTNSTPATLKVLEIINEGVEMSRCIQRLVEDELVQHYQRGSMPDEKIRNALESAGVITSCIQRLAEDELVQHYQIDAN